MKEVDVLRNNWKINNNNDKNFLPYKTTVKQCWKKDPRQCKSMVEYKMSVSGILTGKIYACIYTYRNILASLQQYELSKIPLAINEANFLIY